MESKFEKLKENVLTNTDDVKGGLIYCADPRRSWIDEFNNRTNNPYPWIGDLSHTGSGNVPGDRNAANPISEVAFIPIDAQFPSAPVYRNNLKRFWNK